MSERQARIMVLLPADLQAAIDDYRYTHRIESRTEAIRRLLVAGLVLSAARHDRADELTTPRHSKSEE